MNKVVTDQADGLRRLMASSVGRMAAIVGADADDVASVALNLAAALVQQGKEVLLLDERSEAPLSHAQREGRLVLIHAVLDQQGALSPLAAQADHLVVVLQANAASITQAYVCIKRLHAAHALQRLRALVFCAADAAEAQRILANLAQTGKRYLGLAVESAGWVRVDPLLAQAQRLNLSVVEAFQSSPAAMDFQKTASDLLQWPCALVAGRAPSQAGVVTASHVANSVLEVH